MKTAERATDAMESFAADVEHEPTFFHDILVWEADDHDTVHAAITRAIQEAVEAQQQDLDAGREFMRMAWSELNAIRARDGAPEGVSHEYWSGLVDALGELLGDDTKPWMLGAAKKLVALHDTSALEVKVEREACAQIALDVGDPDEEILWRGYSEAAQKIASKIRARGKESE